jgi:hypothetical protein
VKFYVTFTPSTLGNKTGSALFSYSGIGSPDSVVISGNGVNPTISYQILNNWNVISVPLSVVDLSKNVLFPTAVSDAFEYDNGSGGYIPVDTLDYGRGYWIKFSGAQQVNIQGAVRGSDTIDVIAGWNLIGTISDTVAVAEIEKDPVEMITSEYFGFDGAYVIADAVIPSRGYWVRCDRPGRLIFNITTAFAGAKASRDKSEK